MSNLKTWVEIKEKSVMKNYQLFRSLVKPKTKLWAVVKSNAYGHDLVKFSKILNKLGVDGFCVDDVSEGLRLRREAGIKKPILVIGVTLPGAFKDSAENRLTIAVSNFPTLRELMKSKFQPEFHLKIDTGMHRQGFYPQEIPAVIKQLKTSKLKNLLTGVYTHFASAKDINYPTYTEEQFKKLEKSAAALEKAGFKNLLKHAAATGGTLLNPKYHLDLARIGIGFYGIWPSKELETQIRGVTLKPALSWHTRISEIKPVRKNHFIGYDLLERTNRESQIAVLPVGYWHGFPRSLSGSGEVLINGTRAKILGTVAMDLTVVDVTGIKCKVGDRATLIGRQKNQEITAFELSQRAKNGNYEIVTRINPCIERIII